MRMVNENTYTSAFDGNMNTLIHINNSLRKWVGLLSGPPFAKSALQTAILKSEIWVKRLLKWLLSGQVPACESRFFMAIKTLLGSTSFAFKTQHGG
jgi:hypothetical protein